MARLTQLFSSSNFSDAVEQRRRATNIAAFSIAFHKAFAFSYAAILLLDLSRRASVFCVFVQRQKDVGGIDA